MEYLILKTIHVLSAFLLFGTGLGSAFYKYAVDRSGDLHAIVVTNRLVVLADWIFTTPTVIIQPLTGLWLARIAGWPLDQPWLLASLLLYGLAGACWLPVVVLQIRMRDLSGDCLVRGSDLPASYQRMCRIWFWLGIPAFLAMVVTVGLMVFKPAF